MRGQARTILARRERLAAQVVSRSFEASQTTGRSGSSASDGLERDVAEHLRYLAEAVVHESPELFDDYVAWVRDRLRALGASDSAWVDQLRAIDVVLSEALSLGETASVRRYLGTAVRIASAPPDAPPSELASQAPHAELVAQYLDALLAMRRGDALKLVLDAAQSGVAVEEIYLHVLQPAQWEVGRLWQANQISVAVEHYCTAATQLAMAQLYPRALPAASTGLRVVAAGVGGDLHEIGIRMVSDLLEFRGWSSVFCGTNAPSAEIIEAAVEQRATLLALSVTYSAHLSEAATLVEKLRAHPEGRRVKVLVGGRPFLVDPELWKRVGADATARDAREAVDVASRWAP